MLQIIQGSNGENATVVGVCSACGTKLSPLIIFKGQQVQTTWRPFQNYPWVCANKSGWMNTEVFFKWFEQKTRTYKKVIYWQHQCSL